MPQLDINLLLPIIYWLCLSFSMGFIFIYLTSFFTFINYKKLVSIYKLKLYLLTDNVHNAIQSVNKIDPFNFPS